MAGVKNFSLLFAFVAFLMTCLTSMAFNLAPHHIEMQRARISMDVRNDAFAKANREVRRASASDRIVELRKPMGLVLDEDKDGNVFVKEIEKGSRAERSGVVFTGDYVRMVSATFGEDLWTCRNVGLTRVLSCINVRNNKPVKFVLEAATPAEEAKRRALAYREPTEDEKAAKRAQEEELLKELVQEDQQLLKKRKGLFGLW